MSTENSDALGTWGDKLRVYREGTSDDRQAACTLDGCHRCAGGMQVARGWHAPRMVVVGAQVACGQRRDTPSTCSARKRRF